MQHSQSINSQRHFHYCNVAEDHMERSHSCTADHCYRSQLYSRFWKTVINAQCHDCTISSKSCCSRIVKGLANVNGRSREMTRTSVWRAALFCVCLRTSELQAEIHQDPPLRLHDQHMHAPPPLWMGCCHNAWPVCTRASMEHAQLALMHRIIFNMDKGLKWQARID